MENTPTKQLLGPPRGSRRGVEESPLQGLRPPMVTYGLVTLVVLQWGGGWKSRPPGGWNFPSVEQSPPGLFHGLGNMEESPPWTVSEETGEWKSRPPGDTLFDIVSSAGRVAFHRIFMVGVIKTPLFALLVPHLQGVEESPSGASVQKPWKSRPPWACSASGGAGAARSSPSNGEMVRALQREAGEVSDA